MLMSLSSLGFNKLWRPTARTSSGTRSSIELLPRNRYMPARAGYLKAAGGQKDGRRQTYRRCKGRNSCFQINLFYEFANTYAYMKRKREQRTPGPSEMKA